MIFEGFDTEVVDPCAYLARLYLVDVLLVRRDGDTFLGAGLLAIHAIIIKGPSS